MNRYTDVVASMFKKQEELMQAFKPIERLPAWPIALQSVGGQALMRDFIGRIDEELVEAYDAASRDTIEDELVDTFHFLTELAIFAGVSDDTIVKQVNSHNYHVSVETLDMLHLRFHVHIGRLRHHFKLRPWKMNPKPTNEAMIRKDIPVLFVQLFSIWHHHGFTIADLDRTFHCKYLVNLQRIADKV